MSADVSPLGTASQVPRTAFIALGLAAFGSGMSMRVADPMLVRLSSEFSVTVGTVSAVITAFSVAYGIAQLLFGPLGDRYGKYAVISFACLFCSITTLLCAAAINFSTLLAARLLAGASCAALIPLSMAWIGDVVPYDRRQAVLARFMVGLILGNGVGVLLGGFCADYLDWRIPFFLIAAAFLLTGTYLSRLRRRLPLHALAKNELQGEASQPLWTSFAKVVAVPWARVILASVFIEGALVFGTLAFIPTILHLRLGLSLTAAGSVVMLFGLGGLCFAIFSPTLVRSLGEVKLIRVGACVMAITMLTIGYSPSWWFTLPACFLFGLGFYMMHNTLQINATQMVPARRGAAVAAFASCFFFGQAVGISITGLLLDKTESAHLSIFFSAGVFGVGLQLARAFNQR